MILYHVTYDTDNPLEFTFVPRVPESVANEEDEKIERICFADSIMNCIRGISGYLKAENGEVIVYKYETSTDDPNIVNWKELYEKELVNDSVLTHEYWYIGTNPLVLTGKKYKIIETEQQEQLIIAKRYREKMLEVLEKINLNRDEYISLPTYSLLELINSNEELISIARRVIRHKELKKDYYPDSEIKLFGETINKYEYQPDYESVAFTTKIKVMSIE